MNIPSLREVRQGLLAELQRAGNLPSHVVAFRAWVMNVTEALAEAVCEAEQFTGQARHPEHVATLGYGAAADMLTFNQRQILEQELQHLKGRAFFVAGRPRRFEVDGISLLGVALGTRATGNVELVRWCWSLLEKSLTVLSNDSWQDGLARWALIVLGESNLTIRAPELAAVAAGKGYGATSQEIDEEAWKLAIDPSQQLRAPGYDAIRLAVFDLVYRKVGQVRLASPTRDDLSALLRNVSRGLKRWTYEEKPKTPKSAVARWEVENEYHVQNLLWAVLAPVFSDIDDEENLPSLGHVKPRADLAVPSLRTFIEVKFIRQPGQTGFRKVMEEIAADTSLYRSKAKEFDTIMAVVWDDCAQTEQHAELQSGIEGINGITTAVILSRPSRMKRVRDAVGSR